MHAGDALTVLRSMPDASVDCIVTSPPYWRLRDYGVKGQIGLEKTPEAFIKKLVGVFEQLRRVLKKNGTCWVNMGDCYAGAAGGGQGKNGQRADRRFTANVPAKRGRRLKSKDLVGQPWRLAFALRDDGWYLRRDIIWHKTNPMPEAVGDRPTTAHEYLFLLTKSARYHYDAEAIMEPCTGRTHLRGHGVNAKIRAVAGWDSGPGAHRTLAHASPKDAGRDEQGLRSSAKFGRGPGWRSRQNASFSAAISGQVNGRRNCRSVWTIPCSPFKGAHFATYPQALVRPCILAGCPRGGVVLDPFMGSGTTGVVALRHGRSFVGIELNPTYAAMAEKRLAEAHQAGVQERIEGVA